MEEVVVTLAGVQPERGIEFSVPAQDFSGETVTVKAVTKTTYTYLEHVACRLVRTITVKAEALIVKAFCQVRAFLGAILPKTGTEILRQLAVMNN